MLAIALVALAAPASFVQTASPWSHLTQPRDDAGGGLGLGLAFDDTTLIAGASHAVAGVEEAIFAQGQIGSPGTATVYERDLQTGEWVETQWLHPSLSNERDRFGVSVVLDGDTAFIGSPSVIVGGLRTGAVFRFERVQGQWIERQVITSSLAHDFAGFGNHLHFDGTQLIIGAPFQDGAGINEWGHGFVFEDNGLTGDWVETGVLVPPPMPDQSWAGYRVAIDGDQAALGLFGSEVGGNGAGAICLFRRGPLGWSPVEQILPSVQVQFSHFSYDMILDGDLLITGAYRSGPPLHHHGSLNIFRRANSASPFVEVQRIVPPGLEYGAVLGVSCALLDSGKLAAGMAGAHDQGGRVGIYAPRANGTYRLESIQYPPLLGERPSFGWKVATDGVHLASSAPTQLVGGVTSGGVYFWNPSEVSYERPHCGATNVTNNPSPAMLRSQGTLDMGGAHMRLTLSEVPAQAVVSLMVAPAGSSGLNMGPGCLRGSVARLSNGPLVADPNGTCTWWIGGVSGAAAFVAGTTWTFQVQAWSAGQRIHSNALDVRFR